MTRAVPLVGASALRLSKVLPGRQSRLCQYYLALQGIMRYNIYMTKGDWLTQVRKGAVELCILALLDGRERYGYEIVQELNSPGEVIIAEGSIYPLLKRLNKRGWVTSAWRESSSGPPRKYYSLTERGRAHFTSIGDQWKQFAGFVDRLLGGVGE